MSINSQIEHYTVSEINRMAQKAINSNLPSYSWVKGEIKSFEKNKHKKHIYFELAETNEFGETFQVNSVIWERDKANIYQTLKQAAVPFEIVDDIEVLFKCKVDFYISRGTFSLHIKDIEPSYTLGKMSQDKKFIIDALKKEGLLEKNKTLTLPLVPLRIGLITSNNSAAFSDFCNKINTSNYPFKLTAIDSHMQGKEVESDVCRAIEYLEKQPVDIIAIVRGGGTKVDLSWFDNYSISKTIANCKKPILTGLGHEIDRSTCDIVAHKECITPTATAEYIIEVVDNYLDKVYQNLVYIFDNAKEKLYSEKNNFTKQLHDLTLQSTKLIKVKNQYAENLLKTGIIDNSKALIKRRSNELRATTDTFKFEQFTQLFNKRLEQLSTFLDTINRSYSRNLTHKKELISLYENNIKQMEPSKWLRRGFSLTLLDGKIIKNIDQLNEKQLISTLLSDGSIESIVSKKKANKGSNDEQIRIKL